MQLYINNLAVHNLCLCTIKRSCIQHWDSCVFFERSFPAHEHATKDSKHVGMWTQPAPALGGACAAAAQHTCSYLVHQPNCIRAANKIDCMAGVTMKQRVVFEIRVVCCCAAVA